MLLSQGSLQWVFSHHLNVWVVFVWGVRDSVCVDRWPLTASTNCRCSKTQGWKIRSKDITSEGQATKSKEVKLVKKRLFFFILMWLLKVLGVSDWISVQYRHSRLLLRGGSAFFAPSRPDLVSCVSETNSFSIFFFFLVFILRWEPSRTSNSRMRRRNVYRVQNTNL